MDNDNQNVHMRECNEYAVKMLEEGVKKFEGSFKGQVMHFKGVDKPLAKEKVGDE